MSQKLSLFVNMVEKYANLPIRLYIDCLNLGEILVKLSGIEIINKLLQKCQMTTIVTQVVILVSNLCCNASMGSQMTDTNILQSVLGKLEL